MRHAPRRRATQTLLGSGENALGQVHLTRGPDYLGLSIWF